MMKKLSAYWWCQIAGWGLFLLMATYFYFNAPGFTGFNAYSDIMMVTLVGLLSSHLMRFFIIKARLLSKKIWKQVILMLLTTFAFSLIYSILQGIAFRAIHSNKVGAQNSFFAGLLALSFINCQFLLIWNMIYFSYHYIEKSRSQLIETIRLENELKINQLKSEKAQIEYQRNLGNYYLMALRYQMNPHFIFNCLNSIKLYTVENDTASATAYLTKFSKLIRLVMENSAKGKILLAAELDMLRLYIEMEAMRFKEKLQYTIRVDKNVEADYTELPPLLLQPYVENAIWHGLMPKDEGGRIDINVTMNTTSLLQISIEDNGIGREKAAALRNGIPSEHKSYGMKVTSERIALINQVYQSGAEVKVDDLMDAAGNAAGTKVTLQIPV